MTREREDDLSDIIDVTVTICDEPSDVLYKVSDVPPYPWHKNISALADWYIEVGKMLESNGAVRVRQWLDRQEGKPLLTDTVRTNIEHVAQRCVSELGFAEHFGATAAVDIEPQYVQIQFWRTAHPVLETELREAIAQRLAERGEA